MNTTHRKKAELATVMKDLKKYRSVVMPSLIQRCGDMAPGFRLYQQMYPKTEPGGVHRAKAVSLMPAPAIGFVTLCAANMLRSASAVRLYIKIGNGWSQEAGQLVAADLIADEGMAGDETLFDIGAA